MRAKLPDKHRFITAMIRHADIILIRGSQAYDARGEHYQLPLQA